MVGDLRASRRAVGVCMLWTVVYRDAHGGQGRLEMEAANRAVVIGNMRERGLQGRPADGKPTAGVGGVRSSVEAGNDRGYPPSRRRVAKRCPSRGTKGLCPKGVSKGSGAERLRKRHLTEREIREIGAKRHLIITSNNLQKRRKEKPSYDECSSTGKAGCGKSARPV